MWERLQPREKIMLAVLGVVCGCFVFVKFLLLPQISAHSENNVKLKDLRSEVQTAEAVVRSQQKETELAAKAEELLNEIKPFFNSEMSDGLALVHIGMKAVESNVEIVAFKPSNIVDKAVYLELPSQFEVRGNYRDVCDFIDKMEALPDLSELRTLKIEPYAEKKTQTPAEAGTQKQKNPNEVPVEVIPTQDGRVAATFDIVTFTSPTPEARFNLEQVMRWAVGRYNAFLTPGMISPYPDVNPMVNHRTAAPAPSAQMQNNNALEKEKLIMVNESCPLVSLKGVEPDGYQRKFRPGRNV